MTIRGSKIIQKGRDRIPAFSFCRISFAATAYEFLPKLGEAIGESGALREAPPARHQGVTRPRRFSPRLNETFENIQNRRRKTVG
jgi:hypothetical protein